MSAAGKPQVVPTAAATVPIGAPQKKKCAGENKVEIPKVGKKTGCSSCRFSSNGCAKCWDLNTLKCCMAECVLSHVCKLHCLC